MRARKKRPVRKAQGKRNNVKAKPQKDQETAAEAEAVELITEKFVCSTPKGREFRIPKTEMCPPAPMKQRLDDADGCLSRRPDEFFTHPDIELFFLFTGGGPSS